MDDNFKFLEHSGHEINEKISYNRIKKLMKWIRVWYLV